MALGGGYIAHVKGRPDIEGIVFAVLLGPFGMLIVACLPTVDRDRPDSMDVESAHAARDARLALVSPKPSLVRSPQLEPSDRLARETRTATSRDGRSVR